MIRISRKNSELIFRVYLKYPWPKPQGIGATFSAGIYSMLRKSTKEAKFIIDIFIYFTSLT